ncbi:MAG: hypothetical protein Kow00124_07250 [Anaerolineae bacterium]
MFTDDQELEQPSSDEIEQGGEEPQGEVDELAATMVDMPRTGGEGKAAEEPATPPVEDVPETVVLPTTEKAEEKPAAPDEFGGVPAAAPAAAAADDDWKTAEVKVPASSAGTPPAPAEKVDEFAAAASAAAASSAPSSGAGGAGMGGSAVKGARGLLAQIGITNEDTQKWVLIGGAAVLGLCCLCSCIAALIWVPFT